MKTITHVAALTTALLIGTATLAGSATRASAENVRGITWTVSPGSTPTLDFSYRTSTTALPVDRFDDPSGRLRSALAAEGSTAFSFTREPGVLTCQGAVSQPYSGRGTCTFAADADFEADLRARGLAPNDKDELLAMALLGATRAAIDGLTEQGVAPHSADDVIAAAALEVTPDYVAGLKEAGLDLTSLEDAVACRALGIDADYVRAMADAGYRASPQQLIAMKATGVTPEYARRMNAAARN